MPYTPKVGDYVSYKVADDVLYGRIKDASSGGIIITQYKDNKPTAAAAQDTYVDLQVSNWARSKMRMKPNSWELLENTVVAAAYHPLIARNKLFDAEFFSFVLADLTHEFLTKGFTEGMAEMLAPTSLSGDDAVAFFATADFSDALRKAPFVIALQQLFQKAIFRKAWGHQILSNSFGDFGILAVSNVLDRMGSGDQEKGYTYP